MQHYIIWEDKNGGKESLAGQVDCPTRHLSSSAALQSFSLSITDEALEVCRVTHDTRYETNYCQSRSLIWPSLSICFQPYYYCKYNEWFNIIYFNLFKMFDILFDVWLM